jgi:hypothetical protein
MKEELIKSESLSNVDAVKAEKSTGTKKPWSSPELQEADYEVTGVPTKSGTGTDGGLYS